MVARRADVPRRDLIDVLDGMIIGIFCAMGSSPSYRADSTSRGWAGSLAFRGAFLDLGRHTEATADSRRPHRQARRADVLRERPVRAGRADWLIDATQPAPRHSSSMLRPRTRSMSRRPRRSRHRHDLDDRGIAVFTGDLRGPVRDFLKKNGFLELSADRDLPTLSAAVAAAEAFARESDRA